MTLAWDSMVSVGRVARAHGNRGCVIIDPDTERVLGVGMVGVGAGELIAEGALAVEMSALASDVKLTIHAHPTLSETMMEAAEAYLSNFECPKINLQIRASNQEVIDFI